MKNKSIGILETQGLTAVLEGTDGMITGLHPDKLDEYKKLHAAVWPDVLAKITECNIRNYSIYLREIPGAGPVLFSYFEYIGDNFGGYMDRMAADETTQR